ncbi:acylneuraminate cytidylyltransferase family protein [bacterium]|jgi:CMP-N,N'-diacetyllegionaminic acid synthase|nr:acylneuraminate cytidylyltransferase family protein [bacterium]
MFQGKRNLCLITARGGSKGLPGKNIRSLLGKPLIQWSIEQAKQSKYLDRILLSTEDQTIADLGMEAGAEVPFLRPAELARDDSPSIDTILHALDWLEERGEFFDYLTLLEPTSPLRKRNDLDNALSTLISRENEADSLVALGAVSSSEHPAMLYELHNGLMERMQGSGPPIFQRQQLDQEYFFPNGLLYITKVGTLREERTRYARRTIGFVCERWQNFEVDDIYDFLCVEAIMAHGLKEGFFS